VIATRHNLALDYRQQKHFAEAERAFRECIDEVVDLSCILLLDFTVSNNFIISLSSP
jgi:hypothetical protein